MKIPAYDLICSTDKMLSALGLKRTLNSGWLRDAIRRDFPIVCVVNYLKIKKERDAKRALKSAGKNARRKCL